MGSNRNSRTTVRHAPNATPSPYANHKDQTPASNKASTTCIRSLGSWHSDVGPVATLEGLPAARAAGLTHSGRLLGLSTAIWHSQYPSDQLYVALQALRAEGDPAPRLPNLGSRRPVAHDASRPGMARKLPRMPATTCNLLLYIYTPPNSSATNTHLYTTTTPDPTTNASMHYPAEPPLMPSPSPACRPGQRVRRQLCCPPHSSGPDLATAHAPTVAASCISLAKVPYSDRSAAASCCGSGMNSAHGRYTTTACASPVSRNSCRESTSITSTWGGAGDVRAGHRGTWGTRRGRPCARATPV